MHLQFKYWWLRCLFDLQDQVFFLDLAFPRKQRSYILDNVLKRAFATEPQPSNSKVSVMVARIGSSYLQSMDKATCRSRLNNGKAVDGK